jgi:DNA-binding MarR family transcriptional regulator
MSEDGTPERDLVDRIVEEWAGERPDLDLATLATGARLLRIGELLAVELSRRLERLELNAGWFEVLAALRRHGEPFQLTPTELLKSVLRTSGAMTSRLDGMERAGLIRRLQHPGDRRSVLVELTPRGRTLADRAITSHPANEARLLATLTADEREQLSALLAKLLRSLEPRE